MKRKTILYSAMSIDGFISTVDGGVEWLDDYDPPPGEDYGYGAFYSSLDTTVMGRKTYEKVMSFDIPFPYPDTTNYVITRNTSKKNNQDVQFKTDPIQLIRQLKEKKEGKNIWIVGGGELNTILLKHELIDELILSIIPIVLGTGIPLFKNGGLMKKFGVDNVKEYPNGVICVTYQRI